VLGTCAPCRCGSVVNLGRMHSHRGTCLNGCPGKGLCWGKGGRLLLPTQATQWCVDAASNWAFIHRARLHDGLHGQKSFTQLILLGRLVVAQVVDDNLPAPSQSASALHIPTTTTGATGAGSDPQCPRRMCPRAGLFASTKARVVPHRPSPPFPIIPSLLLDRHVFPATFLRVDECMCTYMCCVWVAHGVVRLC
jgi:hypothetical protein